MHECLATAPTGAEPSSATADRPARPAFVAAAAFAVMLALVGGSAVGGASAAHAQTAPLSVSTETGDPVPFYVVQSSFNGQQEFLFEIAQRFLGDGNRFNEIFDLNKGRTQPDGNALTTPTSVLPGWILQLPSDAKGDGIQVGPLPGSTPSASQPKPEPTKSSSASPSASPTPTFTKPPESPVPAVTPTAASVAASETTPASAGVPILLWIIIAIVLVAGTAAGVLLWLRSRGRKRQAAAAARPVRRPVADRSASWTIDSALKILVAACDDEQIRFPGLYTVTVDDSSIHVLLATPSARIPSGWTASSDGRTWSAPLAQLQQQRVPDASNQAFSRLVTLGTAEAGRILLDFRHATGPVSVEGASNEVTDVIEGWLSEFSGNPWSGSPQIVRLGARDSAHQETLEDFLARVDRADEGIAVLDTVPSRLQGERLRELYSAPDFGWTFIVKGAYAGASWTFTARDGILTSGLVPDVRYGRALD